MRSPLARAVVAAVLSVLTCLALGAQVKIQPPGAGPWEIWLGPSAPGGKTNFKSNGEAIDLPLAGSTDEDLVTIYSGESGNLASKRLGDIDFEWKVSRAEFNAIAVVFVELSHNGQPLAAANVTLKGPDRPQSQLLTPSHKGRLTFKNVKPGNLEISVSTSHEGQNVAIPKQTFRVDLARKDAAPVLRVAIADEVDVVGETAPPAKAATTAPVPTESASPIATLLSMLIGLGLIACVAYAAWRFLPGLKPKIDEQLQRVGVQIPDDPTEPADDAPTSPQPVREPVTPILLGNAPLEHPAALIELATNMRLDLPVGVHLVTREAGSLLSLPQAQAVSRRHAEVERTDGSLLVRDLGSTNGTFVNGSQIDGEVLLKTGDRVQFGDVAFRVEGG
jgi:hypothetical protein